MNYLKQRVTFWQRLAGRTSVLHVAVVLAATLAVGQPGAAQGQQLPTAATERARALLSRAVQQMGGADRWRAVGSLRLTGRGHYNLLEQSERFEGPYIPAYFSFDELRDVNQRQARLHRVDAMLGSTFGRTTVVTDSVVALGGRGRFAPGPADVQEENYLSPGTVLFTALAAPDLRSAKDTVLQGVTQYVVAFTWRNWPVRLFLNHDTGLPTGQEITRPVNDRYFFQIWGDIKIVNLYSFWTLDPTGLRYPLQTDTWYNGQYYRTALVEQFRVNASAPADSFAVPAAVRRAYQARQRQPLPVIGGVARPAAEIAPGVYEIPGNWDVTVVKQSDGLVIIEAPISSAYSAGVLAKAQQLYPGLPVKAVISTSDAWPHFGGLREYAARNIPVYALDLNRPIIEKLLRSSFRTKPDAWQQTSRKKPSIRYVSQKLTLGQGPNRLEIAPMRSETGERMMLVYFPEHHLLYGSDLVQLNADNTTFFQLQYTAEVRGRAEELGWPVQRVFAMHTSPLAWEKIIRATEPTTGF
ncbi:MBL fold metallo-hydrolase [Hymenobacter terrenus]|uniref:hypothetical protein n=1 Tax=Hymenobacter terrenus TaxID=1629124 RepID=UPI00061959C3|nr:hypothetical protein [Hymenobacter terrenus]